MHRGLRGARPAHRRRAVAGGVAAVMTLGLLPLTAGPAGAGTASVVPLHHSEVFPMRDAVGVLGWGEGARMGVRVFRDGVRTGAAQPLTLGRDDSGELDGFGDVNHPRGVCWSGSTRAAGSYTVVSQDDAGARHDGSDGRARSATLTPADPARETVRFTTNASERTAAAPQAPVQLPATATHDCALPGAPGVPVAAVGSTSVSLSWSLAPGNGSAVVGYRVQTLEDGDVVATADVGTTATATITGLTNRSAYTFRVAATNALGAGDFSAPSREVTPRSEFRPPRVVGWSPRAGARSVDAPSDLTVRFSEPVTGWAPENISFKRVDSRGRVMGTVRGTTSYDPDTNTGTFDPFGGASTVLGRDYRFRVQLSSAITDVAGNALDADAWEFTVGPGPRVTARSPRPGATGVGGLAHIRVQLSESTRRWSPARVVVHRLDSRGRVTGTVRGTTSYSRRLNRGTFYPFEDTRTVLVRGSTYRVTLVGITDRMGNRMPATSWTFRTGSR